MMIRWRSFISAAGVAMLALRASCFPGDALCQSVEYINGGSAHTPAMNAINLNASTPASLSISHLATNPINTSAARLAVQGSPRLMSRGELKMSFNNCVI
ncbi:unnamed protein product [Merluccius merluccius]